MPNKQLPNGVTLTEEEDRIMRLYNYRCVLHPAHWMECIHHDPPRSLNPHYAEQPLTWFPLCAAAHAEIHEMNRDAAAGFLSYMRDRWFPNVKEQICQMKNPNVE